MQKFVAACASTPQATCSDLAAKKIYHTLSFNPELEALHQKLHREYEVRFKRS